MTGTKRCVMCAEDVKVEARLCPYCGHSDDRLSPERELILGIAAFSAPQKDEFRGLSIRTQAIVIGTAIAFLLYTLLGGPSLAIDLTSPFNAPMTTMAPTTAEPVEPDA